ncbi:hypothetical protein J5751_00825 [bacterium]|nr:hypothetical protein [bacterium]
MKKVITMLFIVVFTMATVKETLAQCNRGAIIDAGWAFDWSDSIHGFDQSRASVSAYYCRDICFVGPSLQFPSKKNGSFQADLKLGINVYTRYVLFSPYVLAGYTHYRENSMGLPEITLGYGGMINVSLLGPAGVYVDFHKGHFLGENYIPRKQGPMVLSLGFMVLIR